MFHVCAKRTGGRPFDRTSDPLLPFGLRDIVETSVNGLLGAVAPEHVDRLARKDLAARRKMACHAGASAEMINQSEANFAGVYEEPSVKWFDQRVDELFEVRPDLFGGPDDTERIKGTCALIINFLMHGGSDAIDLFISRDPGSEALHVVPAPLLPFNDVDVLEVAGNFTERLISYLRDESGSDPAQRPRTPSHFGCE